MGVKQSSRRRFLRNGAALAGLAATPGFNVIQPWRVAANGMVHNALET